jgi:hypothetical protein
VFEFDPFDPAYFIDPYPYYAEMRAHHPVYARSRTTASGRTTGC